MFNRTLELFYTQISFIFNLSTKIGRPVSMFGLYIIILFFIQCLSGIMLSFSLLGEPMLVPMSRSEEDMDDLYTDDFFWMHERGVDFIFIAIYLHFLRKLFLNSYTMEQETAWKSGSFAFLLTHGVIFFGLVLCSTHLSDVTLKIASNIMSTFTFKKGKVYWWLFTDQSLNTDTLIRMMYAHYCLAFFLVYVSACHALEMHYDWKDSQLNNFLEIRIKWFFELFRIEFVSFTLFLTFFALYSKFLYSDTEPLSNELFTWGDLGIVVDVRFLGVMPHWYFRGYMGWLILCPHHYVGIFGLIFFMVIIYYQPNLKNSNKLNLNFSIENNPHLNFLHIIFFWMFVTSLFYCDSFLPYGKFFNRLNGNNILSWSYFYTFLYLLAPISNNINYMFEKFIISFMVTKK